MGSPRPSGRGGGERPHRGLAALVAALVVAFLLAQTPLGARADDDPSTLLRRIADLDRAIQTNRQSAARYELASRQYQSAVAAANARLVALAAQERDATNEAEELAADIGIAEEQLALLTLQLNETAARVSSLDAQIDETGRLLAERETLYAAHLRGLYRRMRVTPVEMLLSSESLADFARGVESLALASRQDRELAADIARLRGAAREQRGAVDLQRAEAEALRGQVATQRDRLREEKAHLDEVIAQARAAEGATAARRDEAARVASSASRRARDANAAAADLERQKLAAEALYAELAARLQGSSGITTPFAGKFALWPLRGPLTSYFGPRWGGFHNGVDVAAPMYTPIVAASPGVVQVVGKPYLRYGDAAEVIIIAHAANMSTLYGHLDDRVRPPVVAPGQYVRAGQVIGYVGMTGWTTGPHLHFMAIYNGRAVNPLPYLP